MGVNVFETEYSQLTLGSYLHSSSSRHLIWPCQIRTWISIKHSCLCQYYFVHLIALRLYLFIHLSAYNYRNVFCLLFEGKQLLPLSSSVHSSVGQVTWQSTGEASNLVRMRNQSLGQSAPSLTAGLVSVKIWGCCRNL